MIIDIYRIKEELCVRKTRKCNVYKICRWDVGTNSEKGGLKEVNLRMVSKHIGCAHTC